MEIQDAISKFETFYLARHTGRRLTWQAHQGSADIKAYWPNATRQRFELNVSTYQMCILLLFNSKESWTYAEICSKTQIPADELKRHLMSLYVNARCKIMCKTDEKERKEPRDSDVLTLNSAFESKFYRSKVPLVALKSANAAGDQPTAEGSAGPGKLELPPTVEEDRKHLVEAVIVRIMKSRKTLQHNQLIEEVIKHLSQRFAPSPQLIKQRIEKYHIIF